MIYIQEINTKIYIINNDNDKDNDNVLFDHNEQIV